MLGRNMSFYNPFVAWTNLSLDIIQIKGIQIQIGKLCIFLCPDIQVKSIYTLSLSFYDLVKVGSDTTIESKFDKRTAPSISKLNFKVGIKSREEVMLLFS